MKQEVFVGIDVSKARLEVALHPRNGSFAVHMITPAWPNWLFLPVEN
jgi:hypothetical protein